MPEMQKAVFLLILQKICWGIRSGCPASGHLGSLMGLFKIQAKTQLTQESNAWWGQVHMSSLQVGHRDSKACVLSLLLLHLFCLHQETEGQRKKRDWAQKGVVWGREGL